MYLRKIIVILLVIYAILGSYFEITRFYLPTWIEHLTLPGVFEFSTTMVRLLDIVSYVFIIAAALKLMALKKFDLIGLFRLPIYLFVASNLFWFITTLLSSEHSFMVFRSDAPLHHHFFKINILLLLLLIVIHYWTSNNDSKQAEEYIEVSKFSRLLNWVIDHVIILLFGLSNLQTLSAGSIQDDIVVFDSMPTWFFALNIFCYYFILEFLFLQSIGKLHNNSTVLYKGNKIKSILLRTLSRFIPFEAFSFFASKGWHDSISQTQVVQFGSRH